MKSLRGKITYIVDWPTSKISAHISSVMLLRAYPQVMITASRIASSLGRPFALSHGSSRRSLIICSSSSSCGESSPDMQSNRNGFSVVEKIGVGTFFLSSGEAVAYYVVRCIIRLLDIPGSGPMASNSRVLHNPLGSPGNQNANDPLRSTGHAPAGKTNGPAWDGSRRPLYL